MTGTYVLSADGITLANQPVSLLFLNPGTTRNIEVLRLWASQSGSATSAQQRIEVVTQVSAFPTLTSKTPEPLRRGDAASVITGGTAGAAGTSGINASAEGAGAKTVVLGDAFNVLNGWLWVPGPSETILLPASSSSGLGLFLPAAAASLTGWAFGMVYREV